MRRFAAALLVVLSLSVGACIQIFQSVAVKDLPRPTTTDSVRVVSSVKVHLANGSTVIFPSGALLAGGSLTGDGRYFAFGDSVSTPVATVPLDSVAAMEGYDTRYHSVSSLAGTVVATAVVAPLTAVALVAMFGSCPTIYSYDAGHAILEAEAFSYSIAPLLEHRDVDRLVAQPGPDGIVTLALRNEALETHYINYLELLEVRHATDETVAPDPLGQSLALRDIVPATQAVDRAGRDVATMLRETDGTLYATDPSTIAAASPDDIEDYIDLAFPVPAGVDSVAVLVRLRNSLLNTVLLYDEILGASGARAIDWLSHDLTRISTAVEISRWYTAHMGLRLSVPEGPAQQLVTHAGDVGPIAFHDVVMLVPVVRDSAGNGRARLSFTADNWRIDRVAVARTFRRPTVRAIPVTDFLGPDGAPSAAALRQAREIDEEYLVTLPSQHGTLRFATGAAPRDSARTFLLASQGYYIEWIRGDWVRTARRTTAFAPTDSTLFAALRRWSEKKPGFEQQFYDSKIAVR